MPLQEPAYPKSVHILGHRIVVGELRNWDRWSYCLDDSGMLWGGLVPIDAKDLLVAYHLSQLRERWQGSQHFWALHDQRWDRYIPLVGHPLAEIFLLSQYAIEHSLFGETDLMKCICGTHLCTSQGEPPFSPVEFD